MVIGAVQIIRNFLFSAMALLLMPCAGYSQEVGVDYDWKLKRDRDGIQIYLSSVPGSKFKAIRSVMQFQTQTRSLVALVMDLPNCPNWAAMCKEARSTKYLSETESLIYTHNDLPFPVRDRDVFSLVKWSYEPHSGKVSMVSRAVDGEHPKNKGIIRIEKAVTQWHFTPLSDGDVLVESYAHVDPNGATPAWLTNLLMVDSPYKTMKNMRDILQQGSYKDAQIAFLSTVTQ